MAMPSRFDLSPTGSSKTSCFVSFGVKQQQLRSVRIASPKASTCFSHLLSTPLLPLISVSKQSQNYSPTHHSRAHVVKFTSITPCHYMPSTQFAGLSYPLHPSLPGPRSSKSTTNKHKPHITHPHRHWHSFVSLHEWLSPFCHRVCDVSISFLTSLFVTFQFKHACNQSRKLEQQQQQQQQTNKHTEVSELSNTKRKRKTKLAKKNKRTQMKNIGRSHIKTMFTKT